MNKRNRGTANGNGFAAWSSQMKHDRKEQGFSLIELLIASFILITGVVAVAVMIGTAISRDHSSKNDTVAMGIAEQQMEILKATPYANLTPGGSTLQSDGRLLFENPSTGAPIATVSGYFNDVAIANSDQTGQTVTYQVRWNIAWADTANRTKRITVAARRQPRNYRLPPVQLVFVKAESSN
jgi:type II secretory pathway pseudopilin PulG